MGNRSFFNALHDREGDFLLATVLEGPAQGERVLLRNTAPVWPEKLPAFWGEHLPALAAVTSSGILKSAGQRISGKLHHRIRVPHRYRQLCLSSALYPGEGRLQFLLLVL